MTGFEPTREQPAGGHLDHATASGELSVGHVDDPSEAAADRAADRVLREFADAASASAAPPPPPWPGATSGDTSRIQRRSAGAAAPVGPEGGSISHDLESRIQRSRRGGEPLEPSLRGPMESALRTDLGGVRVHRSAAAESLSRDLGAQAFSVGPDVFLPPASYRPDTAGGLHLLSHEVAHTVQSGGGRVQRKSCQVIRRLWTKKQLYAQGGNPSLKSVKLRGRSTYAEIGHLLDQYARLDSAADQLAKMVEIDNQIEGWLQDAEHQEDGRKRQALQMLQRSISSTRRGLFLDKWMSVAELVPNNVIRDVLSLMLDESGIDPSAGEIDQLGTGNCGDQTKQLILFAFTNPRFNVVPAERRAEVRDKIARFHNIASNLRKVAALWPDAAHAQLVGGYFATRWVVNGSNPSDIPYFEEISENTAFYVWRHLERAQQMGAPYNTPAFQQALTSVHPTLVRDIGQKTDLVARQAGMQGMPPQAAVEAAAAQQAFAQHDYVESRARYEAARDLIETGRGAALTHENDDVLNPPRKLGGALNEVIETTFDDDSEQGFHSFFKAEEHTVRSPAAAKAGMDNDDIRQGDRTIATYLLDQLLGTDVIPRTEWASRNGVFGTAMQVVDGGYVEGTGRVGDMALHTGGKGERVPKPDEKVVMRDQAQWTQEGFQKGMSNLQLLDAITGQLDRHPGNIFVLEREGTGEIIGVVGIDNDLAFGRLHTDPSQGFYNAQGGGIGGLVPGEDAKVSHNTGIPLYIDLTVGEALLEVQKPEVVQLLEPHLTDDEIEATWSRIDKVQTYIRNNRDKLVPTGGWNAQTAGDTLALENADYKSYYAREALYRHEKGQIDVVEIDRERLAPIYGGGGDGGDQGDQPQGHYARLPDFLDDAGQPQVQHGHYAQLPDFLDDAEVGRRSLTEEELAALLEEEDY